MRTKVHPIPWSPKAALPIRSKHNLIEGSVRKTTISVVHLTIPGSTVTFIQLLELEVASFMGTSRASEMAVLDTYVKRLPGARFGRALPSQRYGSIDSRRGIQVDSYTKIASTKQRMWLEDHVVCLCIAYFSLE